MKNLHQLINSLNKYEYDLLLYFYLQKKSKLNETKSRIISYFKSNTNYNEIEIIRYLSKQSINIKSTLINIIINDVLNIILLQDSNKKFRSKSFVDSYEVKKGLVFSELLYRRGLINLGDIIIKNSLKIAVENEMYGEILVLLDLQRITHGILKGPKVIDGYRAKVENYKNLFVDALDTVSISYDISIKGFGDVSTNNHRKSEIESFLTILKRKYSKTKSDKIGYWYFRTAVTYYLHIFEFKKALSTSKSLLNLIEKSNYLNTPVNIAGANAELAKVFILNMEFNFAIPFINISLSLFNPKLNNYLTALGSLFLANFHSDQMKECWRIIDQAVAHPKYTEKKENATVWNYYKVCILFKEGKFSEALKIYNQIAGNLSSSKDELYIYSKLLFLYIQFETNKSVLWSYEIASFRKIIPTIKNVTLDRFKIIFQLLHHLDKNEFDFPYVEAVESDRIQKLQENNFQWKPLGFELIQFEKWFKEKILSFNKTSKLNRRR